HQPVELPGAAETLVTVIDGVPAIWSSHAPDRLVVLGSDSEIKLVQNTAPKIMDFPIPFIIFMHRAEKSVVVVDRRVLPDKFATRRENECLTVEREHLLRRLKFRREPGGDGQLFFCRP